MWVFYVKQNIILAQPYNQLKTLNSLNIHQKLTDKLKEKLERPPLSGSTSLSLLHCHKLILYNARKSRDMNKEFDLNISPI